MTIPIVEVFNSIEGEGVRSGKLCTFIRVAGCNLRCSYCDTTYSFNVEDAKQMTVEEIYEQVKELGCKTITITGGEPLLQGELNELVRKLLDCGCEINIETNGAIDINVVKRRLVDPLFFTIDWKCPSSGMNDRMLATNLKNALPRDVFKFVVGDKNDLIEMARIIKGHNIAAKIYVSPVFSKIELTEIVDFMKLNKLHNVILQVQLHKIIWDPSERGV